MTLRNVAVVQGDVRVVRVGRVQLAYGVGDLMSTGRTVRQITIDQPVIDAIRTPEGWNVARLLKPRPPADPNKPRATFTLPDIRVTNAVVTVREIGVPQTQAIPRRIEGLTFEGGDREQPARIQRRHPPPDVSGGAAGPRPAIAGRTHRQRAQRLALPVGRGDGPPSPR